MERALPILALAAAAAALLLVGSNGRLVLATSIVGQTHPISVANKYQAVAWNQQGPKQYPLLIQPIAAVPLTMLTSNQLAPAKGVPQTSKSRSPVGRPYGTRDKKKIKKRYRQKQALSSAAVAPASYKEPVNKPLAQRLSMPVAPKQTRARAMDEDGPPIRRPPSRGFNGGHFNGRPNNRFAGDWQTFRPGDRGPSLGMFGGRENHFSPPQEDNQIRTFSPNPFQGLINGIGRFSSHLFSRSLGRSVSAPLYSVGGLADSSQITRTTARRALQSTARSAAAAAAAAAAASANPQELLNDKTSHSMALNREYSPVNKPSNPIEQIAKETALSNNEVEPVENKNQNKWLNEKYRNYNQYHLANGQSKFSYQREMNEIPTLID